MANPPDLLDGAVQPTLEDMAAVVASPLWGELCGYMEAAYKSIPKIEHSICSMRPGWNAKYRKAGRGLCTLYPEKGGFVCMVVIGQRESAEAELTLPTLSPYTQQLYRDTKDLMGQRWLMVQVTNAAVLADVKCLLALRRKPAVAKSA